MHSRREIALGFTSCYFTPFLSALLMLLIPNTTAAHAITYTNALFPPFQAHDSNVEFGCFFGHQM